jgi:hypothetical protein
VDEKLKAQMTAIKNKFDRFSLTPCFSWVLMRGRAIDSAKLFNGYHRWKLNGKN